jgi:hypothetical protein
MRRFRLWALLALATAAYAALTVAPATAGGHQEASAIECSSDFSSVAALTGASGTARTTGGAVIAREKETEKYSGSTEITSTNPGAPTAGVIDVYFHVITKANGRTGAVSDKTIDEQIAVLNLSFGGMYSGYGVQGVNTGFSFRLAGVTRTANDAWFAQETFAQELEMKGALKRGDSTDLNIYSTSGGGFLGWAYYPSITASQQYRVLDGVLLHYGSLPGGFIKNFNLGYTATHEVGHWLGMAHTFEFGCQGWGDYVQDTPYQAFPTSGCPIGQDSCTRGDGVDPIHNYMDYSYDSCYIQFTQGQTDRAQKQFAHWRLKRA